MATAQKNRRYGRPAIYHTKPIGRPTYEARRQANRRGAERGTAAEQGVEPALSLTQPRQDLRIRDERATFDHTIGLSITRPKLNGHMTKDFQEMETGDDCI